MIGDELDQDSKTIRKDQPADFVTHLRVDRNAITDANRRTQSETQGGGESTGLIGELLGQVNDEVTELDGIMPAMCRLDRWAFVVFIVSRYSHHVWKSA